MRKNTLLTILVAITVCLVVGAPSSFAASIYKKAVQDKKGDLFTDTKARSVGDIVTILIEESNSASESAKVGTSKGHDMDFSLTNLFGAGNLLFGKEDGTELTRAKFSGENKFDGQSETTNTGKVSAQLSAVVKEVLPNGNLLIEGRRAILYNKEKKNIIVSGVVRPQDITAQNTVLSTYVADASITFEGKGDVSDQSQPGFLSKLFNWIPIF